MSDDHATLSRLDELAEKESWTMWWVCCHLWWGPFSNWPQTALPNNLFPIVRFQWHGIYKPPCDQQLSSTFFAELENSNKVYVVSSSTPHVDVAPLYIFGCREGLYWLECLLQQQLQALSSLGPLLPTPIIEWAMREFWFWHVATPGTTLQVESLACPEARHTWRGRVILVKPLELGVASLITFGLATHTRAQEGKSASIHGYSFQCQKGLAQRKSSYMYLVIVWSS